VALVFAETVTTLLLFIKDVRNDLPTKGTKEKQVPIWKISHFLACLVGRMIAERFEKIFKEAAIN
jgi:hypothetical protein